MKTKQRAFLQKTSAAILSLTLLAFLFACNPGAFGTLDRKVAIDEIFESGQILENHTYYYIGPDAQPEAIMAIDNKYTLAPSFWKQTDITPSQLALWNLRIDNRYRTRHNYHGAVIYDQDMNRLGVWYSHLKWTTIKRGEGNTVIIYTPDTTRNIHKDGDSGTIWGSR